jgi:putative glutamine amidotransferase
VESVYAAGGEPVTVHPSAPGGVVAQAEVAGRLAFAHGVLLPGGGDLSPGHYGGADHEALYDMDAEQDGAAQGIRCDWCRSGYATVT